MSNGRILVSIARSLPLLLGIMAGYRQFSVNCPRTAQNMLKISLLGRPAITLNDESVSDFVSEKALLLLCYLAMEPAAGGHPRPTLAALLWGDMPDDRARANLRMALYSLQKLLPDYLEADRKTVSFNTILPSWLDVTEFRALQEQEELAALETAVSLYRGEFLQGLGLEDAPEMEEWLRLQRESLRLQALAVLDQLIIRYAKIGAWEVSITVTRQLLAIEPWREESHRMLMRLLARSGQFNAALAQYETCRALLESELGVEPMAETVALYHRIQQARQRPLPHNLPPQPNPFIGREAELGQLFALLNNPQQRLITIAGPGGSGKTRLALAAAAAQAYAFLDGVVFVPLASVESTAELTLTLANALGLTLTSQSEDRAQLLDYLRQKEMLLVLDNVEHVVDPTADLALKLLETAVQVKLLVTSREYLRLRWETRLPLAGLPTPPAQATENEIMGCSAVQLFLQVAQRVRPDFTLSKQETAVAHLCRVVEGVPLAIELAAALLDRETPGQLLAQVQENLDRLATTLRDVPARHRSLRAVFDHSWALLTQAQQETLARLALFQGGFTANAAAVVAGASPSLLADLAAKSLLQPQTSTSANVADGRFAANSRFAMHEVLRHYALEQLQASNAVEAATANYAAHFANLLQQAAADLHGPDQTVAARRLWADIDNIQAAWKTAVSTGNLALLQAAAPGLSRFFQVAGLFQTGAEAFSAAADALPDSPPLLHLYRAAFLLEQHEYDAALTAVSAAAKGSLDNPSQQALANLITASARLQQGEAAATQEAAEQALAIAQTAGNQTLEAQAWRLLGRIAELAGNYATAEEAANKALHIYETTGDPLGLAQSYQALGIIYFRRGANAATKEMLEKALAVQRQVDPTGLSSARVLVNLGSVTYNLGQQEQARQFFQEALNVLQRSGDRSTAALAADMLGRMAAFNFNFEEARAYYAQALAWREEIGQHRGVADVQRHLADLEMSLGAYAAAEALLTAVLKTYAAVPDRRSYGTTLTRLALARHYQGDHQAAKQQAEEALAVAAEVENPLLHSSALTSLGHALRGLEQWDEAAAVYQEALIRWQEAEMAGMAVELSAALAAAHMANGRLEAAMPLVEEALNHLQAAPWPDCEAPGALYLDCIKVLKAAGDGRAPALMRQAQALLEQRASSIGDAALRRSFLEKVSAHRQLIGALHAHLGNASTP